MIIHFCAGLFIGRLITRLAERELKRRNLLWPNFYNQAVQSERLHMDLFEKIVEMDEDCFTNNSDWKELLPICQYSDNWYAKTHPEKRNFIKNEDIVTRFMA